MNFLKKQSTAWFLTAVMIIAAICIGAAKAPNGPDDPEPGHSGGQSVTEGYYVLDQAGVLSAEEVNTLSILNSELMEDMGVVIGFVTVNYGGDLGSYALRCAEDMGLTGQDFIVVLDISGENYWLMQGADLLPMFTDQDCSDFAWNYMEKDFARGRYGKALINLGEALAQWCCEYFQL